MREISCRAFVTLVTAVLEKLYHPQTPCRDIANLFRRWWIGEGRIAYSITRILVPASVCLLSAFSSSTALLHHIPDRVRPSLRIQFDRIDVPHGLSHGGVNCILKDRQGFLWFGTANGLNRYDGYSFEVFHSDPSGGGGPGSDLIYALFEDRSGHIWIGSVGGGLSSFDPVRKKFTQYKHEPGNANSLSSDEVYAILEDQSGRLWIGTRGGLDQFDTVRNRFTHLDPDPDGTADPITNQVTAVYERLAVPGVLWLGTWGGGLKEYNCETGELTHYRHQAGNARSLSHNAIRFIYETPAYPGILWIGTEEGGLNRFDVTGKSFTVLRHNPDNQASLSHDAVRSMLQDRDGILWVGTNGGGLNRFDPVAGTFLHYTKDPRDTKSLSNDHVIAMLEDETGVHWLGTREGVNRFGSVSEMFVLYQHDPNDPWSLSDDFLYSLLEDRSGILWIASGKGLNRFDAAAETFTAFLHDPHDPMSLRSDYVRTVYEDRRGTLWVGTNHALLHRFDRVNGRCRSYSLLHDPKNDNVTDILSILETRDGILWVGTTEGLNTFDRESESHTWVVLGPLGRDRSHLYDVHTLYQDTQGNIWIGTGADGLLQYTQGTGGIVVYRHDNADPRSISHNSISYVCEDHAGTLWVATNGGGLNRFDGAKEGFTAFTKKEGFPDNIVYGFLEDNAWNLWLSTQAGLCRFTPATNMCRNFEMRHGLQGSEFNSRSFCKSRTGVMYFGGVNGLNAFHPDDMKSNVHVPPVFLTAFKSFDRDVRTDSALSYLTHITMPYSENFLSFEFTALDFKDQVQNTFAHMLEGLDKEWIQSGTRRYAAYTDLAPGEYVFRVQAANNDGLWNLHGTSLHISITPSYWQTWWFKLLTGGVLGGFLMLWSRREVTRLRREKRLQQEFSRRQIESEEAERKRLAAELHDGLGQDLLVVSNELQQYLMEAKDVHPGLMKIASLLQELIEEVREITSDLYPHHLERLGLRAAVEVMAENLSRTSGLTITTSCDDVDRFLSKKTKIHVYRIIQEALTNVVRHASARQAMVQVKKNVVSIEITVADDGKGFDPDEAAKRMPGHEASDRFHGLGLSSMRERARIIGGRIEITSSPRSGTKVHVRCPFVKDAVKG